MFAGIQEVGEAKAAVCPPRMTRGDAEGRTCMTRQAGLTRIPAFAPCLHVPLGLRGERGIIAAHPRTLAQPLVF